MKLVLTNRYPYPYPDAATDEEKEKISEAATDHDFTLSGVKHFQWLHTVTVEFDTLDHYKAAKAMTGWERWGSEGFILEAPSSTPDGYGHPAIIVGSEAWCGFMLMHEGIITTKTTIEVEKK